MGVSRGFLFVSLLAAMSSACTDSSPEALAGPELDGAQPELGIYGHGIFDPHRTPCAGPMHRQFDFWLGEWDVFSEDGSAQIGTNIVRDLLDGCIVEENWTGAGGGRGRSLNTYDSETGQWHQTWVAAQLGHLRMAGGIDDQDRMVLEGQRFSVRNGVFFFDTYTWTVLGPDEVRQDGLLSIPDFDLEFPFTGIYRRGEDVTPAPELETPFCQPGEFAGNARQLDFWVGEWQVENGNGRVLGTSSVTTDLNGCLVEEHFTSPKGYRSQSFAYYDPTVESWYRTFIDNEGERFELAGGLDENGRMVLEGEEGAPGEVARAALCSPSWSRWKVDSSNRP